MSCKDAEKESSAHNFKLHAFLPKPASNDLHEQYLHRRILRKWCMTMCKLQGSYPKRPYISSAKNHKVMKLCKSRDAYHVRSEACLASRIQY
jgi:hypothetical protein